MVKVNMGILDIGDDMFSLRIGMVLAWLELLDSLMLYPYFGREAALPLGSLPSSRYRPFLDIWMLVPEYVDLTLQAIQQS